MVTIRAYTTIEQSKKLAEILPLESADMCYMYLGTEDKEYEDIPICAPAMEGDLCAWSLAALLGVLPFIDFTTPQLVGTPKTLYRCQYNDDLKSHAYDNPIDACVAMIEKLKELNLL